MKATTSELRQRIKELKEDLRVMKGAYFATHEDLQKANRQIRELKRALEVARARSTIFGKN